MSRRVSLSSPVINTPPHKARILSNCGGRRQLARPFLIQREKKRDKKKIKRAGRFCTSNKSIDIVQPIVGWRDSYELLPSKRPISSRWKGGNVHTLQVILHVCISLFFFFFSYISKETKGKKYTPVRSIIDFLLLLELL